MQNNAIGNGMGFFIAGLVVMTLGIGVLSSPSPLASTARRSRRSTDGTGTGTTHFTTTDTWTSLESHIVVHCDTNFIKVTIPSPEAYFSGMVYPQGLSKNSTCLKEYVGVDVIEYLLPLRSCNTMTSSDGPEEEFFNTVILEPHPKLVTGQGKGFHIRCKYLKKEDKKLPTVNMKILKDGVRLSGEHVNIGDPLVLNISILHHAPPGHRLPFRVTDCNVKDGLGWAEEALVNDEGCPLDGEIMSYFTYTENAASVQFLAHKFPYSPSVYYACAVKICRDCHPPICDGKQNLRRRRDAKDDETATIEVYNGLYVNEASDAEDEVETEKKEKKDVLCFNKRDFALAIAISGLILMIAVLALIFVLCVRRRNSGKGSESGGSSIYSGGYTNTAYSHSS
jgi:hypothetical protein